MAAQLPLGDIGIPHRTAVSCVGVGTAAHVEAIRTGRSGLRPCDYRDVDVPGCIGRVEGVEETLLPNSLAVYANRATQLAVMAIESGDFIDNVGAAIARHGAHRVGLVTGTSTSGVEHLEELYSFYGREPGVRIARKHLAWYCKGRPGAATFWQRVNRVEDADKQLGLVRDYFQGLADHREHPELAA